MAMPLLSYFLALNEFICVWAAFKCISQPAVLFQLPPHPLSRSLCLALFYKLAYKFDSLCRQRKREKWKRSRERTFNYFRNETFSWHLADDKFLNICINDSLHTHKHTEREVWQTAIKVFLRSMLIKRALMPSQVVKLHDIHIKHSPVNNRIPMPSFTTQSRITRLQF